MINEMKRSNTTNTLPYRCGEWTRKSRHRHVTTVYRNKTWCKICRIFYIYAKCFRVFVAVHETLETSMLCFSRANASNANRSIDIGIGSIVMDMKSGIMKPARILGWKECYALCGWEQSWKARIENFNKIHSYLACCGPTFPGSCALLAVIWKSAIAPDSMPSAVLHVPVQCKTKRNG